MTSDEIEKVARICLEADGGCVVCSGALCTDLISQWPEHRPTITRVWKERRPGSTRLDQEAGATQDSA